MPQPDYENDLVFPPKEEMNKCNENCHCAFRCLSNDFCDAAEIRIKALKEELQRLRGKLDWETYNNKALENQLTETKEQIKKDNKALGLMCNNNDELLALLKDVRKLWKGTIFMPETQEQVRDVLTRVNAVIGESEE